MTLPLVSICIPTYNGERFIYETLNSVVNQTYKNLEILITDDDSVDRTHEIVSGFDDPRVQLIPNQVRLGAEGNWNKVVHLATGEFVKIMGQDDILLPTCVETEVDALQKYPLASFCWSKRDIISPKGRRILRSRGAKYPPGIFTFDNEVGKVIASGTNTFGEPCAVLMRTKSLNEAGDFKGQYVIDLDMWIRLWEKSPAVFTGETTCQFRISNQSWTTALRGKQALQVQQLFEKVQLKHLDLLADVDLDKSMKSARRLEFLRIVITKIVEIFRI